jgi:predicted amidophosphoribosyltransferase
MTYYDEDDEDDDANQVRCANCGKWIPAVTSRCPECRFDFRGEAQDFGHESADEETGHRRLPLWVIITAMLLALLTIFGVFNFAVW